MVIQHNLAGLNSKRNQKINESKLKKNLEKLSSGYRINRAGDDAAGLGISEQLRFAINSSDQALQNIEDGINLIQTTEGALQEIHTMLNRMNTCAVASSNSVYDDVSRAAMDQEVQQLKEEIQRIAEDTDFYNIPLLDEDDTVDIQFQIGPSGADDSMDIDLPDVSLDKLGIEMVSVATQDDAMGFQDTLKDAINYISDERGRMGAYQLRLEHAGRSLAVTNENITAAESRIRDTDMAMEITGYTKDNIILQASQSMMTQANAVPKSVLNMIQ